MSSRPGAGSGWLYLLWRWRRLLGQDRIRLSADEVRHLEPDLSRPVSSDEPPVRLRDRKGTTGNSSESSA